MTDAGLTRPSAAPARARAYGDALFLNDLRLVDVDAIAVLRAALLVIEDAALDRDLTERREEHERHLSDLAGAISAFEGDVIDVDCPSALGLYLVGKIERKPDDLAHILLKVRLMERLAHHRYREMAEHEWPEPVGEVVRRAARDERRHDEDAERALGEQQG